TTVVRPEQVAEPARVVLIDHGRHASLVLPADGDRMVRYAYGEWGWYALRKTGPLEAVGAMLVPTRGALGRRVLPGPVTRENVRQQLGVPIEQQWPLLAEASRVRQLRGRLDRIYRENIDTEIRNPAFGLDFVHHPDSYSYFHNSNHVTADWLEQLGFEIEGPAFSSRWTVEPAEAD
ncbi:MAG: hypothetical protein ACOCTI_05700, partial [Phycisphaeraceae bacterium]